MARLDHYISTTFLSQKAKSDPAYIEELLTKIRETKAITIESLITDVFRGPQISAEGDTYTDWMEFSPVNQLTIKQIMLRPARPIPAERLAGKNGRPTSGIIFFIMTKQEALPRETRLLDKGGCYLAYDPVNAAYRIACPNSLPTIPSLTMADQQALDLFKPLLVGIQSIPTP